MNMKEKSCLAKHTDQLEVARDLKSVLLKTCVAVFYLIIELNARPI